MNGGGDILGVLFLAGFLAWIAWVLGSYLGRPLWGWWMRRVARNWPLADATIETGYVDPCDRFYAAMLGYSYEVSGKYYSGYWRRGPTGQDSAEMLVVQTRGRNLAIRYKPEKPADSVVRLQDNPKWVPWSL